MINDAQHTLLILIFQQFFPNFRLFYAKIAAKSSNWPGPGLKPLSCRRDPGRLLLQTPFNLGGYLQDGTYWFSWN